MKKLLLLLALLMPVCFSSCGSDEKDEPNISLLPSIPNVSLDYHSSIQKISLPRDVSKEGAKVSLKNGVSWISGLKMEGDMIEFNVEQNHDTDTGHRYDSILIVVSNQRIGSICVSQARKPISDTQLKWAVVDALYRNAALISKDASGIEITKAIYNLEKTTNGQDSYKNYPAFAFCIEMNHDPDKNMEWHLPSIGEMTVCAEAQSYSKTPLFQHNYWWSATENSLEGNRAFNLYSKSYASRGAVDKGGNYWVMAFRNGKIVK